MNQMIRASTYHDYFEGVNLQLEEKKEKEGDFEREKGDLEEEGDLEKKRKFFIHHTKP